MKKSEFCKGMSPFYRKQFNPYSCSAASVAIVLNTIIADKNRSDNFTQISQHELLQKVREVNWRKRVSVKGFEGKHGLTVPELGTVVESALTNFGIPFKKVDTVPIHKNLKNLENEKEHLFSLLVHYCRNQNHYMIAHFTQGVYTGDWFGAHISPVEGFDISRSSVLILDVDPDVQTPYWVPFNLFFEGLIGESKKTGPEGGGYVNIVL